MKDAVIFRTWLQLDSHPHAEGGVIALFPHLSAGFGHCLSYEHFGQHGGADLELVLSLTRPASPDEYRELKKELEEIGYVLEVVKAEDLADSFSGHYAIPT